jgi:hypothetical protein
MKAPVMTLPESAIQQATARPVYELLAHDIKSAGVEAVFWLNERRHCPAGINHRLSWR